MKPVLRKKTEIHASVRNPHLLGCWGALKALPSQQEPTVPHLICQGCLHGLCTHTAALHQAFFCWPTWNIPLHGTNPAAAIGASAFPYSTQKPQFPGCGTWSCHHKQHPAILSSAGNFPLMQRRRWLQLCSLWWSRTSVGDDRTPMLLQKKYFLDWCCPPSPLYL